MVTLILVFCLTSEPAKCRTEQPPNPGLPFGACARVGQAEAADWLQTHPGWSLKAVRCRWGSAAEGNA